MSLPIRFLEGRTALVTGASAGIGRHIARTLANAGMNLVLAARSESRLAEVQAEIEKQSGVKVLSVPTDVSSGQALALLVDRAMAEFKSIDVLVNNAGIDAFGCFEELAPEQIRSVVDTNLTGALLLTQLVIPRMLDSNWGHIVNMASTAGKYGPPYGAAYAATKAALIAFTQSLRVEFRKRNIRASAICPGFTHDGGIYETLRAETGLESPFCVGSTTAEAVAKATLNAIRKDLPEVIVNSMPLRPFFGMTSLFPRLGEYLFRRTSLNFFRAIGKCRHASPVTGEPTRRQRSAA